MSFCLNLDGNLDLRQWGTRISPPLDTSRIIEAGTTNITWEQVLVDLIAGEAAIRVFVALSHDRESPPAAAGDWAEATNNGEVPGVIPYQILYGSTLWVKQEMDTSRVDIDIVLKSLTETIPASDWQRQGLWQELEVWVS